jgi:hypothetical protein
MRDAHLTSGFRHVDSPRPGLICVETTEAIEYRTDPADDLPRLVAQIRPVLWRIASSLPQAHTAATTCI